MNSAEVSPKFAFSIDRILQTESSQAAKEDKCDRQTDSFSSNGDEIIRSSFQNEYLPEPSDPSAFFYLNHIYESANLQNRINLQNALNLCFSQCDQFNFKDLQEYQFCYGGVPGFYASDFGNKRKGGQIRFTSFQTKKLEQYFSSSKYLAPEERKRLADQIKLSDRQVKTWFQNRRAKWRRGCEYKSPKTQTLVSKT